jgi:hypothetical protein
MTLCIPVGGYQGFGGTYRHPEDEGDKVLRNVGDNLQDYTMS